MNTIKIAFLLVRLAGLQLILLGIMQLPDLPKYILMAQRARPGLSSQYVRLEIMSLVVGIGWHALCGLILYLAARPIANMLNKGIDRPI